VLVKTRVTLTLEYRPALIPVRAPPRLRQILCMPRTRHNDCPAIKRLISRCFLSLSLSFDEEAALVLYRKP